MKKGISIILAMCLIMGVFMPVTGKATDDLGYYSWEGEWDSDWGNIVITQKGNQISGTYTHDNGRISGMVSGNTITGTWAEYPSYSAPNDAGDIIFEMASDGKSFSGKWRFGNSGSWSDWGESARKTTVLPVSNAQNEPDTAENSIDGNNSGESTTITVTASSNSIDTGNDDSSSNNGGDTFSGNISITVTSGSDQDDTSGSDTAGGNNYICSDWARGEVQSAGLMGLIPDRLYGVDLRQNITRAEFAALSVRVYENISGNPAPFASMNPFYDTSDPEVLKAAALGITNGVGGGRFGSDTLLTRQQAAVMLTRSYKAIVLEGWTLDTDSAYTLPYMRPATFADNGKIASWASDSVYFMAANSILNGVGGNMFSPDSNATREQSIVIAVRMCQKLSSAPSYAGGINNDGSTPTPGNDNGTSANVGETPSTGRVIDNASATGTVNGGGLSISFDGGNGGTMSATSEVGEEGALTNSYSIEMSSVPVKPMTISLQMTDTPATGSNLETFLMLAFPYVDASGGSGYIDAPVRATVNGDTISATIDPAEYGEYMERVFSASDSTGTMKDKTPTSFDFRITGTQLVFWYQTGGKFKCYANRALAAYTFGEEEAQRLITDLEGLYATYVQLYPKVIRNDWPMNVYIANIGDNNGTYVRGTWSINGAEIHLSQKLFDNGYSKETNTKVYTTMAHELFHFIQNNYVSASFAAEWFDEATATYMEYKYGNAGIPLIFGQYSDRIWEGLLPYWTNKWSEVGPNGYGRFIFIDYLCQQNPEFIKEAYEMGGRITASGWNDNIRIASGKKFEQLVGDFFESYITTKQLAAPLPAATIYKNPAMFDYCAQIWNINADTIGRNFNTSVKIGGYGAHCIIMKANYLPAGTSLEFTVPSDTDLRSIVFDGSDKYKVTKAKGSTLDVPLKGHEKLMLLICDTSGSSGVRDISATIKAPESSGYSLSELFDSTMGADSYTFIYPGGDTSQGPIAVTKTYCATHTDTKGQNKDVKLTLDMAATDNNVTITCSDPSFSISGSYDETTGLISSSRGSARFAPTWGGFGIEINLYGISGELEGSVSMAGGMWAPIMP
jgi:hypothetical protein